MTERQLRHQPSPTVWETAYYIKSWKNKSKIKQMNKHHVREAPKGGEESFEQ